MSTGTGAENAASRVVEQRQFIELAAAVEEQRCQTAWKNARRCLGIRFFNLLFGLTGGDGVPNIRELRASQRRTPSLYDTWFTRRVSVYVTALALLLGLTPNMVSTANLLVGMAAWVLIALDIHALGGVVLIHVYAILDSVDGEVARHTRCFSLRGCFWKTTAPTL